MRIIFNLFSTICEFFQIKTGILMKYEFLLSYIC